MSLRTGSATDIVESEVSDAGVHLEEKRERLANATGRTENGDRGELEKACQYLLEALERCQLLCSPNLIS